MRADSGRVGYCRLVSTRPPRVPCPRLCVGMLTLADRGQHAHAKPLIVTHKCTVGEKGRGWPLADNGMRPTLVPSATEIPLQGRSHVELDRGRIAHRRFARHAFE